MKVGTCPLGRIPVRVGPTGDEAVLWALVDTGAALNVISSRYCEENSLYVVDGTMPIKGWSEDNKPTTTIGMLEEHVWLADCRVKESFAVVRAETTGHDMILGLPFLERTRARLDYNVPAGMKPLAEFLIGNTKIRVPITPDETRPSAKSRSMNSTSGKARPPHSPAAAVETKGWAPKAILRRSISPSSP